MAWIWLLGLAGCVDAEDSDTQTDTGAPGEGLFINEFMASNHTAYTEDGERFPDWLELYNAGSEAVDLDGYFLTDDLERPTRHEVTESLVVEPGGFLLLLADEEPDAGPEHLSFRLSILGEDLALLTPDGRTVDEVVYGEQTTDIAAARVVDGSEEDGWTSVAGGTPGASNSGY